MDEMKLTGNFLNVLLLSNKASEADSYIYNALEYGDSFRRKKLYSEF